MKRTFNYTGRIKIPQDRITITLQGDPPAIRASLNLKDLDLPPEAPVVVEAYHRTQFWRFDFGTVASPRGRTDCLLDGIRPKDPVRFRVKVVGSEGETAGRLLAEQASIPVSTGGENKGAALLGVEFTDLGDRIWKLDFSEQEGVRLLVNKEVLVDVTRSETFKSLVLPEALENVLRRMLIEEKEDPDPEDPSWRGPWYKFVTESLNQDDLPDRREQPTGTEQPREEWIAKAVENYCRRHKVMAPYQDGGEAGNEG